MFAVDRYRWRRSALIMARTICGGMPSAEKANELFKALNHGSPVPAAKALAKELQADWSQLIGRLARRSQAELQAAMSADAGPILARYQRFCVFVNQNFKCECEKAQKQHPPLSIFDVAENVMLGLREATVQTAVDEFERRQQLR
jgi:hypothetical protein